MLSSHSLLVAAVFIPYLLLMVGLGYHIYRTGCPDDPSDSSDQDEGDDDVVPMTAAA